MIAVTSGRTLNTWVRSNWPSVVNDGVTAKVVGIDVTPAIRARTVVTRMLITSAARILSTHRTIVRIRPIQNTKSAGVVGRWNVTTVPWPGTTKPPPAKPMIRMNSPMPTPIAFLRPSGTAFITASRKPTTTSSVTIRPSQTITPIAPAGERPWPVSENATMALMPSPAASANG